jgi:ribosomal protein S12 methylthiotransferase accessory factor YcaO
MTVDSSAAAPHPPAAVPLPAGLDWVSQLPSAAAPGFVYLAGACRGVAVGGGGRDRAEAALRLAGETAEVLAQLADPVPSDAAPDPAIDAAWTASPAAPRVAGTALATGRSVGVPAAAIFLGAPRAAAAPPPSLGLAAGPDRAAARLAGLLELVERDAAAAWWCEGRAPHQLEAGVLAAAAGDLPRLRAGAARVTGFLALASPTGVPVACAFSRDRDGRGLAVGLKAAPDPVAAATGALIELLQMELALEMARHRAARGATAPGDHGPLARAGLLAAALPAFAALPPLSPEPGPADLATLAARCGPVTIVDLPGVPGGPAVAKVLAPGLRPLPGCAAAPGTAGTLAPLM